MKQTFIDSTQYILKRVEDIFNQNDEIQKTLKIIQNTPESHFKTYSPIYIAVCVLILGFFTQFQMFRINRKNSLKMDLAEFYSSLTAKHRQYQDYINTLSHCNFYISLYKKRLYEFNEFVEGNSNQIKGITIDRIENGNEGELVDKLTIKKTEIELVYNVFKIDQSKVLSKIYFLIKNEKFLEQTSEYERFYPVFLDTLFDTTKLMDEEYVWNYYKTKLHHTSCNLDMKFYEIKNTLEKYN